METSSERRKRKLSLLCDAVGGAQKAAEPASLNWQSLSQVMAGTLLPPKKDGSRSPKALGDSSAAALEEAWQLGRGWFDNEQPLPTYLGGVGKDNDVEYQIIGIHPEDELPDGFIHIPEHNIKVHGGNGRSAISYEVEELREPATFRLSWLQRLGLNPKYLLRFKVAGVSMEPVLPEGNSVLVNTQENQLEQIIDGKVYAIRYGNELRIKHLFYSPVTGILRLHSANPAYKDEELTPSQVAEHITLIGRVRDQSGPGGL
ncbi:S24 family peptidase [Lampropedia aestuarii]|uniref:S24 family peptidase n=1 Tax=Lampropedia aestuarii TaxID=2562762 RepID=A0A4S5BKN0_9BURK|nr:S24 family peptidase [Lampropedia aestuarii]THJ32789.1 S24 family peptidase [Lampropedia aestuarii]